MINQTNDQPYYSKYNVSQLQHNLLQIGNLVIRKAKRSIPSAGNILVNDGPPNWEAYKQCMHAQIRIFHHKVSMKYRRRAFIARHFGGGNCLDYASLSYILLRRHIPKTLYAAIIICTSPIQHAFAAILRKPYEITAEDIIIDAWPPKAQALLFKHHMTYGNTVSMEISIAKKHSTKVIWKENEYGKYLHLTKRISSSLQQVIDEAYKDYKENPSSLMKDEQFFMIQTGSKDQNLYNYIM